MCSSTACPIASVSSQNQSSPRRIAQVGAELALVGEDGGVPALPGRERLHVVRDLALEEVRRLAAAHEELRAVGAVHQPGRLGDQLVVACGDHTASVLLGETKHEIWARQTFAAQAARGRGRGERRARAASRWCRTRGCITRSSTAFAPGRARRRARRPRPAARAMTHPLHAGRRRQGRPEDERVRPAGDPARLRRGHGRGRRARVGARRRGEEIEVAPGVQVRRLDLQRPRARPDAARPRGRAARGSASSTARSTRTRSTSTASTASRSDGVPGIGARQHRAGRVHDLRVRRHARSASTSTTATPCRWPSTSPRASTARSSSTRRPGRPTADELVMVMNGFDTNFDRANEVYAVNTVAFAYMHRAGRGRSAASWCASTWSTRSSSTSLNSFHIHANFFDYYPTGTRLEPRDFTDTVIQGQGERGILELRFPYTGKYMFHAHVSRVRGARLDGLLRGDRLMEAATAARPGGRRGWRAWRRSPCSPSRSGCSWRSTRRGSTGSACRRRADGRAHRAEAGRDRAARAQRRRRIPCASGR